jgi:hypothetical protein
MRLSAQPADRIRPPVKAGLASKCKLGGRLPRARAGQAKRREAVVQFKVGQNDKCVGRIA